MKVFEFDFGGVYEWVCAESKEQAIKWYKEEITDDPDMWEATEITECDLNKDWMWYDVEFKEVEAMFRDYLLKEDRELVLRKNKLCNSEIVAKMTFGDVIKLDNITKPCIIASTEH